MKVCLLLFIFENQTESHLGGQSAAHISIMKNSKQISKCFKDFVCNRGDTILYHGGLHTDFKSVQSRELGQFQIFWKRTTANQIVSTTSILSSNIWLFSYLLFIAWNSKTVFTCRWRGCWMMLQRFWKGTTAGQIVSTRILSSNGTILWWTNRRRSGQGTR